jgi:hypothetical protein
VVRLNRSLRGFDDRGRFHRRGNGLRSDLHKRVSRAGRLRWSGCLRLFNAGRSCLAALCCALAYLTLGLRLGKLLSATDYRISVVECFDAREFRLNDASELIACILGWG